MNKEEAARPGPAAGATTGRPAHAAAAPSSTAAADGAGATAAAAAAASVAGGRPSVSGTARAAAVAPAAVRATAAAFARPPAGAPGASLGGAGGTIGSLNHQQQHHHHQQQQRTSRRCSTAGGGAAAVSVGDLPIHKHRDKILNHINNNFITCIQGETGCGKSTQVPKFLLDQDAEIQKALQAKRAGKELPPSSSSVPLPPLESYRPLKCIVTQPRRLACISLAQRVARELGEDTGGLVGYRISGESKTSRRTKIFFMTTGYLLQILINAQPALSHILTEEELNLEAAGKLALLERRGAAAADRHQKLEQQQQQQGTEQPEGGGLSWGDGGSSEGYLDSVTHVILDEVHERDVDADLLSLVLKLQLRSRVGKLKVIVMSATMEGNLFFNYFSDIHLKHVGEAETEKEALDAAASTSKQKDRLRAKDKQPALAATATATAAERKQQQQQQEQTTDECRYEDKIFVGAKRFPVHTLYIDDLLEVNPTPKALRPVSVDQLSGEALLIEGRDETKAGVQEQEDQQQQQQKKEADAEPGKPAPAFSSSTAKDDASAEQVEQQQQQQEGDPDIFGALLSRKGRSLSNLFTNPSRWALLEVPKR